MASNVGKAISGFSKALRYLPKHKADKLRGIIAALRGFNSLIDAVASGSISAALSSARNIGASLKEVAKYSRKASGLRWGFRRAGAFIPILGTVVEGEAARRAILRSQGAARAGNEAAAAIWAGAGALHLLSSTLSGCVDLLLLLSVGTAGAGYAVLNGVVSGLGAVADIAGELAE